MEKNIEAIEYYKAIAILKSDFDLAIEFIDNIKSEYTENDISLTDTIAEKFYADNENFIHKYREQDINSLPFSNHVIYKRKYTEDYLSKYKEVYDLIFSS